MPIVDSGDTSQIEYYSTYGVPWYFLVSLPQVYNHSLSAMYGQGSAVFRFTGSRVDVVGTEFPAQSLTGAISYYTLDQQTSVMHTSLDNWLAEQDGIVFYSSGNISYGDHVLVINVTQASTAAAYYLDYISYISTDGPSLSSSSSSSSSWFASSPPSFSSYSFYSSSSSTSTSNTGKATSTTDTGLPTISTTSLVEKSNNVNAIVGGVVGGAVGLIAMILAIFFFCFRRRMLQRYTARKRNIQSELPMKATDVTPHIAFDLDSSPHMSEALSSTPLQIASRASGEHPSSYPREAARTSFTLTPEDSASQAGPGALMIPPSGSRLSAPRKSGVHSPVTSEPLATHHADSGPRLRPKATSPEIAPADIPPVYTPN